MTAGRVGRRKGELHLEVRSKILLGGALAVVFLLLGIVIPWPGSTFPQNLSWLWIAVAMGIVVPFLPRRFFVLWLFLGLVLVAVLLSWSVPARFGSAFFVYVAGLEIGATVLLAYRHGQRTSTAGATTGGRRPQKPEALIVAVYPRDDIHWPDDGVERRGVIEVRSGVGDRAVSKTRRMGEFSPFSPGIAIGSGFALRVTATCGREEYEREFRFRVTGDENDVQHYTVGPGIRVPSRPLRRKSADGFEFGATVMGAKLEQ
ncbi:hypothetical protein ACO2Q7_07525 [Rathayibacter sp. KR2-224]|uniref:hypothetical protein n=1 Tax=Rathayibacter sp. KR2-224 TaxID=3400913 RepID=UPI003C0C45B7